MLGEMCNNWVSVCSTAKISAVILTLQKAIQITDLEISFAGNLTPNHLLCLPSAAIKSENCQKNQE